MSGRVGLVITRESLDSECTYRSLVHGRTTRGISGLCRPDTADLRYVGVEPSLASGIESKGEGGRCRCPAACSPARSKQPPNIP